MCHKLSLFVHCRLLAFQTSKKLCLDSGKLNSIFICYIYHSVVVFLQSNYKFSLKESVYKAMHPILCDYVGMQEAEIDPLADGTAVVRLNFLNDRSESVSPHAHSMVVRSASWRKVDNFFLTSASVEVKSEI